MDRKGQLLIVIFRRSSGFRQFTCRLRFGLLSRYNFKQLVAWWPSYFLIRRCPIRIATGILERMPPAGRDKRVNE